MDDRVGVGNQLSEVDLVVLNHDCSGPNPACVRAHAEGRRVHMFDSPLAHRDGQGRLVLPSYHFFSVADGVAAISRALDTAVTVSSDEEWLRLEREKRVPFRTRPGMNHPTRR